MKNSLIIGFLKWIALLMIGLMILGCSKDEEVEPNGSALPNSDFFIESIDLRNGVVIDDYEAPATINIQFKGGFDEMNSWKKVEIDYGDGIVDIIDPFDMHIGIKSHTYYNASTFTIKVTTYNNSGSGSSELDVEIKPCNTVKKEYLGGRWYMIQEKNKLSNGNGFTNTYEENREVFHFGYDESNFQFSRISFMWNEYEQGIFEINRKTITLAGDQETYIVELDSFFRYNLKPAMALSTTLTDSDQGNRELNIIMIKEEDPFLNELFPGFKWSVMEEQVFMYEYSEENEIYNKLIEQGPKSIIPYNHKCINLIGGFNEHFIIDNWDEGTVEPIEHWMQMNMNHYRLKFEGEEDVLLVFDRPKENQEEGILNFISTTFIEDNGKTIRVENHGILKKNDGSEATISSPDLIGSWIITSKTETLDGIDVDPTNSETPSVDDNLTFNEDGTADLGTGNESWYLLDPSNLIITSDDGFENLVLVMDHDKDSGKLLIRTITNENGEYELIYEMEKLN